MPNFLLEWLIDLIIGLVIAAAITELFLVMAALVPMVPLLGTAIPLQEIFMKFAEMLV